jgi:peptidoglycan/LPS O-acetylase OafA/YrhL
MRAFALWPGLAVFLLVIAASWACVLTIPLFRREIKQDQLNPKFYPQLEGLRGLLAVAVFVHHAVVRFLVLPQTGRWEITNSTFYSQLADAPVLMFFFLTGFLFWSKLLRRPKLELLNYFKGRVRRVTPVYIVAMLWLFLLVSIETGFTIRTSLSELGSSSLKWLIFALAGEPNINGLPDTWHLIAGTPWTLAFEWRFYVLLPFLVWFARKPHRCGYLLGIFGGLFGILTWLLVQMHPGRFAHFLTYMSLFAGHLFFSFGIGILVATVHFHCHTTPKVVQSSLVSAGGIGCLLWILCFHEARFFDPVASLTLGSIFLVIVYGNTFWGLLNSKPLLLLGRCSYSLYLCHGLTLATFVLFLSKYISLRSLSVSISWALISLSSLLALGTSLLCYVFVESQFLTPRSSGSFRKTAMSSQAGAVLKGFEVKSRA